MSGLSAGGPVHVLAQAKFFCDRYAVLSLANVSAFTATMTWLVCRLAAGKPRSVVAGGGGGKGPGHLLATVAGL